MKLIIEPQIFEQNPDFKLGIILIKQFNNNLRISNLHSLLRGIAAQKGRELMHKDIEQEAMVRVWHQTYGRFGINPNEKPPILATLMKMVQDGVEMPSINSLIDLQNYFTLKYLIPVSSMDLDWLCGDLHLTFTKGNEPFRPLGSIQVQRANEGEAAYLDKGGIISRYWNHRRSERAKVVKRTVNGALFIEDMSKMHMDEFGAVLHEIQNAVIKYIGGQIEPYILNEENPSIDLGIQGRTNINDAKIPQQEKAHYLEMQKVNPSQA